MEIDGGGAGAILQRCFLFPKGEFENLGSHGK